jgi:putative lipoic acid-binding regulatory protein
MGNRVNPQPEITFPRQWLFKIIGSDRASLEDAVAQIIGTDGVTMSFSNISSQGAYIAFNVETEVSSREHRDGIYQQLKSHPAVKAVL